MHRGKYALHVGALAALVMLAGCSVNVNKDASGQDKDVAIHTPFGGLQVHNADNASAIETGLPLYPGAVPAPKEDGNGKSVDLQMGFGQWQVRVQVVSYISSDPVQKLQAFYTKALGTYGDVITCRGDAPVGTPIRTSAGLTCKDSDENKHVNVSHDASLELKAGSERRQHIVAFDEDKHPGTHFALISLTLPVKNAGESGSEE
jgi:hypothetical protein